MKLTKKNIVTLTTISITLFIGFAILSFQKEMSRHKLPTLGRVNPFILTDIDGKPYGSEQLKGYVWIANFFFTTCSDICPMMSKNMAQLHRAYDLDKNVYMVSVTVNPENDSPEALQKYAVRFKANTKKWIFLTGTREDITKLSVESFKLGDMKEPIFHSSKFALVDRNGLIRVYYDGMNQKEVNQLFKDIAIATKEKSGF